MFLSVTHLERDRRTPEQFAELFGLAASFYNTQTDRIPPHVLVLLHLPTVTLYKGDAPPTANEDLLLHHKHESVFPMDVSAEDRSVASGAAADTFASVIIPLC